MKKKVIALTLTAVLALSSTSAFAATANCTTVNYKYDFNNLIKNFEGKYANANKQYKVTVNGKEVDLNSIDWKTVLKQYAPAEKPAVTVEKPDVKQPEATKPVENSAAPAPAPAPTAPVEKPAAPAENTSVSSSNLTYEQKVVELVNVERQKQACRH